MFPGQGNTYLQGYVFPGQGNTDHQGCLSLTNFRDWEQNWTKSVLNFAIVSLFLFSQMLSRGHLSQINKTTYFKSEQDNYYCKLITALYITPMDKTKYNCLLRMLSLQCTVQSLKCNLRCSVDVHSSKITRTQNILNILIVVFSKMVLNFAESFVCAH